MSSTQHNRAIRRGLGVVAATTGGLLAIPAGAAQAAAPATAPLLATQGAHMTYQVKAGDTVWGISRATGVSIVEIKRLNRLGANYLIRPGQRLSIPVASAPAQKSPAAVTTAKPAPKTTPAVAAITHRVAKGDTVWALSRKYGVPTSQIIKANSLSAKGLIRIGQTLVIRAGKPAATPAATPATPKAKPAPKNLVPSTFLGRTYPSATVASANQNKATLNAMSVPSRQQMQVLIRKTAQRLGVDPRLALAVGFQESGFNQRAVSPANAIGTMQVIPSTGTWAGQLLKTRINLLDPSDNVSAGVVVLRQLIRTSPDLDSAIAGYYQGQGSVRRNGMYPDTKRYVAAIKNHMKKF